MVVSIFQMEVQEATKGPSYGQEIVPSDPYDSHVLVLNHASFPRGEENGPKE